MCISSVSFSVLVNGSPSSFFSGSKGLRQGDPLSSLLITFTTEVLSKMIDKTVMGGMMSGFKLEGKNGDALTISHLLFASNTIIFCGVDSEHITNLRCLLMCFMAVTRLRVNLNKSEIAPIGIAPNVEELAAVLCCKVSSLPITFLGLPLGSIFKAHQLMMIRESNITEREFVSSNKKTKRFRSVLYPSYVFRFGFSDF